MSGGTAGSTRHAEIVRKTYDMYFDRAEPGSLEAWMSAFMELLHPDIELHPEGCELELGPSRGTEAVADLLETAAEMWDAFRYEVDEVVDLGTDRLVVSGRIFARGRGREREIEVPFTNVWTIRDGKAVRIESYVNREHFLDVVGREALAGGAEPGPPQRRTST